VQLTDEQKQKVSAWIAEGQKLSEIQQRIGDEFAIRLTYMEARLLVDDLKLTPLDPVEPAAPPAPAPAVPPVGAPAQASPLAPDASAAPGGKVSVKVDEIMRPGSIVSGSVTFSDGGTAVWYLDQTGRLGLAPATEGYRPPPADVPEFQQLLDRELQRMGF
jgi:hypothetical protein